MTPQLTNTIDIPGMIPKRIVKRIVFDDAGLTIKKQLGFEHHVFISTEEISAFRFGISEMHIGGLRFCRQYFIETRDFKNEIYRIKLNSFFGIKDKALYNAWGETIQRLWDFYLADQLSYYKELFHLQQVFELSGVTFHPDGISWDNYYKLKWNEIEVSSHPTHFVVHHASNPTQFKCCVFSIHWNALILHSLLKDVVMKPVRVPKRSWL